jgi:Spy/CpxP family protein refolding chaperone
MAEIYEGWQCIGCGKIDVDRPCIGICQDERVALVLAGDFNRLEARNQLLESIVRRMVLARPHPNAREQTYRALQAEAVRMLSNAEA